MDAVRRVGGPGAALQRVCRDSLQATARKVLRSPLGALAAVLACAGVCGYVANPSVLALAAALLAALTLGTVWPWLALRSMCQEVRFEAERITEGEEVCLVVTLKSRLPVPVCGVQIRGISHPDDEVPEGELSVAVVRPRATVTFRHILRPKRRGCYPKGLPVITTSFPFGLWEARRPLDVRSRLLVWPRTFSPGPVPPSGGARPREGAVHSSRSGTSGDILGVRPFRRGDSLRRVHWAQTARHDRLIVCEQQATQLPLLEVVLDTDSAGYAGTGPDGSREWAIRVAASLCAGWCEQGAQVQLVHAGRRSGYASGLRHRTALLDELARLNDADVPLAHTLEELSRWRCDAGLRVLVSSDSSFARSGHLLPPVPRRLLILLPGVQCTALRGEVASAPPGAVWIHDVSCTPAVVREGLARLDHGTP